MRETSVTPPQRDGARPGTRLTRAASPPPTRNVPGIRLRVARAAGAFLTTSVLVGCGNDIVYRDRLPFNAPPAAAAGFLGYYDATAKKTTCGNCHADFQGSWAQTKHASAWANLNASSAKKPECFTCHTVTGNGNVASGSKAGHDAVQTTTYYDVQCESCHGPGLEHVESVGQGSVIRPLAKLSMEGKGTCGDCHSGAHQPFAEEWGASRHANLNEERASNANCVGCHESRGFLAKWGVDENYQEKANAAAHQPPATCAVCHNPHGSENPAQLRFPVTSTDPELNLCVRCHLNRGQPNTSSRGAEPHAPQGAVLLGFAGYRPPGFQYDTARIFGSHATEKNPKLCAGCHINKFTVNDKLTGAFTFQATGHLMRPIPCLDAQGKPTADKTCAYTADARSWQTCSTSACHGSAAAAVNAFNTVRSRMRFLADQLWKNLDNDATLDAAPTDAGLLATLKATRPTEWSGTDNRVSPAEGAEFNARICGEYNQANADNSKGVHNPFLCEALLIASIDYIRTYYGLPAPSASTQALMEDRIGGAFSSGMRVSRTPLPGR